MEARLRGLNEGTFKPHDQQIKNVCNLVRSTPKEEIDYTIEVCKKGCG